MTLEVRLVTNGSDIHCLFRLIVRLQTRMLGSKPMTRMPRSGEPSESERRLHELTHLPYRDWCEHCVKSKGRQSHAVKKNDRQPVIQIDFSLLSTENDRRLAMQWRLCCLQRVALRSML